MCFCRCCSSRWCCGMSLRAFDSTSFLASFSAALASVTTLFASRSIDCLDTCLAWPSSDLRSGFRPW